MAQAPESSQPIELCDHHFSLDDGLTSSSTTGDCEVILPSNLADGKRKTASSSRPNRATKRKVTHDASTVVLRSSSRVANMSFSYPKPSVKGAVYIDLSDEQSDDSKGSPLGDNVSIYEENDSGNFEEKTYDDCNQAESLEHEDNEDQDNPTATLMEEDNCGDSQVAGANALMKESAVDVGPCEDDRNKQDGLVLLKIGGTSFEPHLLEIAPRDSSVVAANLVSGETPFCTTSTCFLAPNLDKAERVLKTDLELRFRNFIAYIDIEDCLSDTIDDIARPLSSIQPSFEGGKVSS
ncbi:uncharacterized protein LOC112200853 [Rosa chinensis]|uniref:uncharacterized protein LOC112200853 n=1 Tax=Rosa chinensis TaxID=74649 RepID=UPI001AD8B160|nr:uncharacterized protein LOC112200853 [Rosa chinensis]